MVERSRRIPKDVHEYVEQAHEIADRILEILEKKGVDQRDFASFLGKHESEISRWLSGNHNFTLRTLCKIQSFLGEKIITVFSESDQPKYPVIFIQPRDFKNSFGRIQEKKSRTIEMIDSMSSPFTMEPFINMDYSYCDKQLAD